jgi:prephenate dehydrogenase
MQIGIIGFGGLGRFIARHLNSKAEISVMDITNREEEAKEISVNFVPLDEILKRKIIILAIPMENLEETLLKIKDKLIPGTLILDVCSLKLFSCNLMKNILPKNIKVIGTHPLFGPNSANSLKEMKIAICKTRSNKKTFNKLKSFLESLGLKVIITTPEEHDRMMAKSQALLHFVCNVAKELKIKKIELGTKTFDNFAEIVEILNKSPDLSSSLQKMNPFAKTIREEFIKDCNKLNKKLEISR